MTPAVSTPQNSSTLSRQRNPWLWIPSLYFSQGIPYVIVMTMSVVMYKRLGISNTDIALYTSWLYLPWVLKPLWSPLVDITRTKRLWVVSMQFLVSFALALAAFSVRGSAFFKASLFLFWIMAFASATHDIAADGFYMLGLSKHDQTWWVGLRSTFYRAAMIVGSGLLVVLAGVLETKNGLASVAVQVRAITSVSGRTAGETEQAGEGAQRLLASPASLDIVITNVSAEAATAIISEARHWNQSHEFLEVLKAAAPGGRSTPGSVAQVRSRFVVQPLEAFLMRYFPRQDKARAVSENVGTGNIGVLVLRLSQPPAAGQKVIVTLDRKKSGLEYVGLAKGDKGFRLLEGERLVFTPENWNQGARAVIQLDPKLKTDASVTYVTSSGDIPLAWSTTLFVVAGIFLAFSCWHGVMLPRPSTDGPVLTRGNLLSEFFATLGSFFKKPGILLAMAFILLYRFDEAQLGKVISPFLLDAREKGGLGLTTSQVGLVYGTFGILALTCGGLLGGFTAARYGLKTMLPIMVLSMYLPKSAFVFLSFTQPENFLLTCGTIALEQFGYGFGFTAFMLYLLYFADGPHKTAHYAICTGFMALGMMLPGMWSGWLADVIGYKHFFVWVIFSTLPGFCIAMLLKVDPQFGRKASG